MTAGALTAERIAELRALCDAATPEVMNDVP